MLLIVDDLSSTPVTNVTRQSHAYFGVVNLIGGLAGPLSCQLCVTLRVNSSATRLNSRATLVSASWPGQRGRNHCGISLSTTTWDVSGRKPVHVSTTYSIVPRPIIPKKASVNLNNRIHAVNHLKRHRSWENNAQVEP